MGVKNKIIFLTLRTFSATGGIEKVTKVAGKALYEICQESGKNLQVNSMYDPATDIEEKYFPAHIFHGYGNNKVRFIAKSVNDGIKSDVVILSHINLLPVGYLIKFFSPKTKLVLLAHGIEVWKSFSGIKKRMLQKCDSILAVSSFTKNKIIEFNKFTEYKTVVLNNCLDPFLVEAQKKEKDAYLLARYNLKATDIVLMALTRLSIKEKYKGYDKVILSVASLQKEYPNLKYLIVGKYDAPEKARLDEMIKKLGLEKAIIFTGYIPDEELADHYNLGDVFSMPSTKEGFGIVFIEAMFYRKPVIAGNKNGSVDALGNGEFGLLVNPDVQEEITNAIRKMIVDTDAYIPDQELLLKKFSYAVYKNNLQSILKSLYN